MYRIKVTAVAAFVGGCAAVATASAADDPGSSCVEHDECWEDHICQGLVFCFTSPVFPDQQSRIDCFDDGNGNGVVAAYNDCMENVCAEGWSRGAVSVATVPSSDQCQALYEELLTQCYAGLEFPPFGCPNIDLATLSPTSEQLKSMKKYCAHAARMELNHCLNVDETGTGSGNFQNSLFTGGAAETAEFAPQQGVGTASWLKVPGIDEDAMINGVVTRALLWTEDGWAWATIHESGEDPDGLVSTDLAVDDIAGASGLDYVEILLSWTSNGEVVHVTPMRLDFADSGLTADFNRDGSVNVADLNAFIDAYSLGAPRADFNADGSIDSADLSAFIAAFDAN